MKVLSCPRCGGELKKHGDNFECAYCRALLADDTLERAYAELKNSLELVVGDGLQETFVQERERTLANLRRGLFEKAREKYVNSKAIVKICREMKKLNPDDFSANFYELMNDESDDPRLVREFLDKIDVRKQALYVEDVIEFTIKSLKIEYLTSLNLLVERAYKETDTTKYGEIMTRIEREAEKLESGIYVLTKPREVFVAYSSKDVKQVNELVECLEAQGIECFVAMRNLQQGAKSVENYEKALETAMDHCKVFVFVSSKHSRRYDCDAFKREIPYIKQKDLENHLEYRSCYDKLPDKYKMPRVQYRIDNVKTSATDKEIKEFFGTLQWRTSVDEVAEQVGEYLGRKVEEEQTEIAPTFVAPVTEEPVPAPTQAPQVPVVEPKETTALNFSFGDLWNDFTLNNEEFEIGSGTLKKYKGKGGNVVVPSGVLSIGEGAFENAKGIKKVTLPDGVVYIHQRAFANSELTGINLPESLKEIDKKAFCGCIGLTNIEIPKNVYWIRDRAFSMSGLKSVKLSSGLGSIGKDAFSSTALTSITIPSSVHTIKESCFASTPLTSVTVEQGNKTYYSEGNCIIEKETKRLIFGCETSVIPDGVEEIAENAFFGSKIKSITIPSSVTSILPGAFRYCMELESISVAKDNETYYAEGNCLIEKATKKIVLGCKTSVIPKDIWAIGASAFEGQEKLTSIKLPSSVSRIEEKAFAYTGLKSVILPKCIRTLGKEAFRDSSLTRIVLPNGLWTIGDGAFLLCNKLKTIKLPSSVSEIKSTAFASSGLTSVKIPKGVTRIGERAFNPGIRGKLKIYVSVKEKPSDWAEYWQVGCDVVWKK